MKYMWTLACPEWSPYMHVRFIVLYDKLRNSEVLIPYEFEASKITEVLDPEKDFGVEESPLHLI